MDNADFRFLPLRTPFTARFAIFATNHSGIRVGAWPERSRARPAHPDTTPDAGALGGADDQGGCHQSA